MLATLSVAHADGLKLRARVVDAGRSDAFAAQRVFASHLAELDACGRSHQAIHARVTIAAAGNVTAVTLTPAGVARRPLDRTLSDCLRHRLEALRFEPAADQSNLLAFFVYTQ